jgi:hypothetical protein
MFILSNYEERLGQEMIGCVTCHENFILTDLLTQGLIKYKAVDYDPFISTGVL